MPHEQTDTEHPEMGEFRIKHFNDQEILDTVCVEGVCSALKGPGTAVEQFALPAEAVGLVLVHARSTHGHCPRDMEADPTTAAARQASEIFKEHLVQHLARRPQYGNDYDALLASYQAIEPALLPRGDNLAISVACLLVRQEGVAFSNLGDTRVYMVNPKTGTARSLTLDTPATAHRREYDKAQAFRDQDGARILVDGPRNPRSGFVGNSNFPPAIEVSNRGFLGLNEAWLVVTTREINSCLTALDLAQLSGALNQPVLFQRDVLNRVQKGAVAVIALGH